MLRYIGEFWNRQLDMHTRPVRLSNLLKIQLRSWRNIVDIKLGLLEVAL